MTGSFPYISQIHVNSCRTYANFDIPKSPLLEAKHIILTGRNGSGKTSVLNSISAHIDHFLAGRNGAQALQYHTGLLGLKSTPQNKRYAEEFEVFNGVVLKHIPLADERVLLDSQKYIFSHFKAHRRVELNDVKSVTKGDDFYQAISKSKNADEFVKQFKQYLVNKKIFEAFDYMNDRVESLKESKIFFENIADVIRGIFDDPKIELRFDQNNFEFYITLGTGREITFNQMSEGFSAFLSITMDLMIRVDLQRQLLGDHNYSPPGIILIDEPETHFHISMQYQVLPMLTALFPNMQFIVATHSPAIISSIKNAIVFDLSSQQEIDGWQVGSSFSELMVKHFGLDNEFSSEADEILKRINDAAKEGNIAKIQQVLQENEQYLTPALRFEIDSQIIAIKSQNPPK